MWRRRRMEHSSRPGISVLGSADIGAPWLRACTALSLERWTTAARHAAVVTIYSRTCEYYWRGRPLHSAHIARHQLWTDMPCPGRDHADHPWIVSFQCYKLVCGSLQTLWLNSNDDNDDESKSYVRPLLQLEIVTSVLVICSDKQFVFRSRWDENVLCQSSLTEFGWKTFRSMSHYVDNGLNKHVYSSKKWWALKTALNAYHEFKNTVTNKILFFVMLPAMSNVTWKHEETKTVSSFVSWNDKPISGQQFVNDLSNSTQQTYRTSMVDSEE